MKAYAAEHGIRRALADRSGLTEETALSEIERYYNAIGTMSGEEFLEWMIRESETV